MAPTASSTRRMKRWRIIFAAFSICVRGGLLIGEEAADIVESLRQRNAALEERVRNLEEQLGRRVKALEEQVGQKIREFDRKEADYAERAKSNGNEATASKFKASEWVSSIRLVTDLRMRYDELFAPDSSFVTRWRLRPR